MQLLVTPGHSSSNEPFNIDLISLPHLFISFTDEQHFANLVKKLCEQLIAASGEITLRIAMAVNSQNSEVIMKDMPAAYFSRTYITNEQTGLVTDSALLFMRTVIMEFKKRLKRASKSVDGKRNHPKKRFSPLIFISDNILDLVIIGRKKSMGFDFMQLLIQGPGVGINCVVASSNSYQNMLKQLMHIHPAVITILEKNKEQIKKPGNKSLGAELILSAEGLIFFKEKDGIHYNKLYP